MTIQCDIINVHKLPCISNWICEEGNTGLEIDGCGNKRLNSLCLTCKNPSCEFIITT